ncbi:MAG: stage V sporulation protein AD [Clostridiales bacterium]|nr:stage V sporulation protein AD [Clostridiales bacterium]
MKSKIGNQTIEFEKRPVIAGMCSVGGTKEGEGPLKDDIDIVLSDNMYGEKSWEKAESKMLKTAMETAVKRAGLEVSDIDIMFSGDLLNQLMSSAFMARDMQVPFIGLYGACSTMTQSMLMAASMVNAGYAANVLAGASSHFCTAERQFRMPLEHGNQRPPSAQWTATAAGAVCISEKSLAVAGGNVITERNIYITEGTIGKIIDTGMKDANQMGAAMAPAAVDTLLNHFEDTGRSPDYYDIILTGDLGFIGKEIALDLLADAGYDKSMLSNIYDDCGTMIFTKDQDVHAGGSGCGCSACVYTAWLFKKMKRGEIKRALILSTGALLSTISPFQGESIPGIAHAIALESE